MLSRCRENILMEPLVAVRTETYSVANCKGGGKDGICSGLDCYQQFHSNLYVPNPARESQFELALISVRDTGI